MQQLHLWISNYFYLKQHLVLGQNTWYRARGHTKVRLDNMTTSSNLDVFYK